MPKREFEVPRKGTGRPDFSEETHNINKGKIYTEFWPKEDERWKVFLFSWPPTAKLKVGESVHLLDIETFLPTPYTTPTGWFARFAEWMGSFDKKTMLTVTMDDYPPFLLLYPVQGDTHEYERISFFDSRYFDPNVEEPHTWSFIVTNIDTEDAIGCAQTALIMQKVGTPEMKEKKIRCPKCGFDNIVPIEQNKITCVNCGYVFVVPYYGRGVI